MHFLNELYTIFDDLVDLHDLYKLDTVGDCYIVVAGLTMQDDDGFTCTVQGDNEQRLQHAQVMMDFAKAILRESKQVRAGQESKQAGRQRHGMAGSARGAAGKGGEDRLSCLSCDAETRVVSTPAGPHAAQPQPGANPHRHPSRQLGERLGGAKNAQVYTVRGHHEHGQPHGEHVQAGLRAGASAAAVSPSAERKGIQ